ncbi:MAG: hypothetical protein R3F49_14710 [Planctomycetota bacterium]
MRPDIDPRGACLLALLEARRAAPLGLLALLFAATLTAARFGGAAQLEPALAGLVALDRGPGVAAAAARASAATLGLALGALMLVPHAAGLATRWRHGDGDWLGARPVGPLGALAASLLGIALAACAVVTVVLGATGLCAATQGATSGDAAEGSQASARALVWRAGPSGHVLLHAGESFVHRLPDVALPVGAALRVRLQNTVEGAPYGDAELRVVDDNHAPLSAPTRARIVRRTYAEVPLSATGAPHARGSLKTSGSPPPERDATPTARGGLDVVVTALGPGAIAVLGPRPIELWGPPRAPWRADLALAGRALALLIAAAGLAAGFGAWVAAPLATLGVAALALAFAALTPEAAALAATWLPGSGLGAALDVAAEGRLPAGAPPGQGVGAALSVAAGLALARAALRSWRHAA